jgi:small subunit ribosomal protein S20
MPILKSAKKRVRINDRQRVVNDRRRRSLKETVKVVEEEILHKNKDAANKLLPKMHKAIDKAVKSGVLKKNTAARKKSRISKSITSIVAQ